MNKRFVFLFLFTLSFLIFILFAKTISDEKIIKWNEAHLYYGKDVIVEGVIVNTYNSGRACFLNFHQDYKKYLTVVIFASDFHKFPPNPEDYYYMKRVRIRGIIKEYQGKPEIILKDPSQIEVINGKVLSKPIQISWEDADQYYGKFVIVEGTIVATNNTGRVCFLNFHRNWRRYLSLVIFASDFCNFPPEPERYYLKKRVRVKGVIREYHGKPEIILKSREQIEVIK